MLTIVILSCSTQKNTFVNRNFHNLNSHYNVYFNGNEAMKMGLAKIDTRVEEDFTKILPVFKESLPGTETMVLSDMNTAIEKGLKLIKLHSITKPPEANRKQNNSRKRKPVKPEYNKWVDDAYMMIGEAYLFQKDYIRASSTFTQIIRKYKDEPVKYEAYLWLIRSYSEAERYTEAREMVETLEGNDQFPKDLEGELAINAADLHLKQQHYEEAIQYLNIGIKKIKGNQRKIRYSFILAQLYQETGNKEKALEAYKQVIRRRPDYTFLFNAQINMASAYSGDGNASVLRKELNKMSKKKRNEPFLDQIYYALANIIYNEGKINDAIELYKKSAAVSINNKHQRALSCLTLADIYFDQKNYIPSGQYYDSAMVEIDEHYPNYEAISEKHKSLSKLVTNLLEVEAQDSLQLLAGLSQEELNKKIDGWIAIETAKIAQDSLDEEGGAMSEYDMAYGRATNNRMRVNSGSSWYYYNPSTVSYGKKEFQRLWGGRKNEDNWRRKNKSISMGDGTEEAIAEEPSDLAEEGPIRIDDKTTRDYYLQDIPNNDSLMAVSHQKIRDALFNAGTIFKTEFNDYDRSIECFSELNRRYPQNIYELSSYFYLWDLYGTVEKKDSADYYKDLILSNYPNSNYAKYLLNPNYFIEEEARKDSLNSLYSLAFTAYQNNQLSQALQYSKMAGKMQPDSALIPKLRFIEMVSASKGQGNKVFADSLQAYIAKYPEAETSALAKKIFDLVKENKITNYQEMVNTGYINEVIKNLELLPQKDNATQEEQSKWNSETDLLHYFVIAIPTGEDIDANRLKFDIANYNIDNYTSLDFDIETEPLNKEIQLIVVRNFDDKENALIYFLSIIRKPEVFKTLAGKKFINFIISNNNYREMLSDRSYNEYLRFFVQNYSSFTSGEFLDKDLETPEALMARLKKGDDDQFKEQGQFVEVSTDNGSYQAPAPKEQIFAASYDVPHSFMILIKELRYKTGFLMRDMVKFNTDNYRNNRLRVVPTNLTNATLLVISQFPNAYDANLYLKAVNDNKTLFNSLGETAYETFVISNDNLNKLRETNNIDEWTDFYKINYIYRKPPAPKEEVKTSEPEQSNVTQPEEEKPVATPEAKTEEESAIETKKETITPEASKEALQNEKVQPEKQVSNVPLAVENKPAEDVVSESSAATTETPGTYKGMFAFDASAMHNLIYLMPNTGSNQALLSTYVGRFNAMKYRSFGLEVRTEKFDDFSSLVIISGLGDSVKATSYKNEVNVDNRVSMSLRNVNYKSYIITNENLELLKKSRDIQEYQKFYSTYYKE